MTGAASRAGAARVLVAVLGGQVHLDTALRQVHEPQLPARDAALVRELCYGVLRFQPRLEFWLARLLKQPLKSADLDLHALLLCGLYQLEALRIPPHAAVKETVEACRSLGKPWAVKLLNAVLRRFQREQAALQAAAETNDAAHYAHPHWFVQRLRAEWPVHWQAVLDAGNNRPPLSLRVNRRITTREALLAAFATAGITARAGNWAPECVIVETAQDVTTLPGFGEGWFSVQDEAAQLAAGLLEVAAGMRVLDACAAPGGKTCHVLETAPGPIELLALDQDALRSQRIQDNLRRLGLQAELRVGDAGQPATWWDGRRFQRILLDAPCSATGVLRRHPDIKARRTPAQVSSAAAVQAQLLAALWPLLAVEGKLLYVTCSILAEENATQLETFLAAHPDAHVQTLSQTWGVAAGAGRQILPGMDGMDGFYYACLVKH